MTVPRIPPRVVFPVFAGPPLLLAAAGEAALWINTSGSYKTLPLDAHITLFFVFLTSLRWVTILSLVVAIGGPLMLSILSPFLAARAYPTHILIWSALSATAWAAVGFVPQPTADTPNVWVFVVYTIAAAGQLAALAYAVAAQRAYHANHASRLPVWPLTLGAALLWLWWGPLALLASLVPLLLVSSPGRRSFTPEPRSR